jgi:malate dehydrogenase (oxaloacetate-decarboxylating)(NADP+)
MAALGQRMKLARLRRSLTSVLFAERVGVSRDTLHRMGAYRAGLSRFVYHSGSVMQPVFDAAQKAPKRVVYAEGEDERVLRAVQIVVDERLAKPVLVGRAGVVAQRIRDFGLRLAPGRDFELVDPETDARVSQAAQAYYQLTRRKGVTPLAAESALRRNPTALAAMLVRRGDADALLCGVNGDYRAHLEVVAAVIGLRRR